jgi:hypothetical protein
MGKKTHNSTPQTPAKREYAKPENPEPKDYTIFILADSRTVVCDGKLVTAGEQEFIGQEATYSQGFLRIVHPETSLLTEVKVSTTFVSRS